MVCEKGIAKKADNRKFKVKTARGGDDCRSMEEVIGRRFAHTEESFGRLQDLVLIDGGPVQLEFAVTSKMKTAALLEEPYRSQVERIPMISLAKREEEIFLSGEVKPVLFDERHEGRRLLQQVRDESHRFAIGFHRKRKGGKRQTSALETIPGVGPARMEKLLIRFRSLEGVAKATPEEVAEVPGITQELAEEIVSACGEWVKDPRRAD